MYVQHFEMMTNEKAFRIAQKRRRSTPEPIEACFKIHGMENRPAPRMLLIKLRIDGINWAVPPVIFLGSASKLVDASVVFVFAGLGEYSSSW